MSKKIIKSVEKQVRRRNSEDIQEELQRRAKEAALLLGVELLEEEVKELCGAVFSHKKESLCHRGGSETTSIVIGSSRYQVKRPRVRNKSGEVQLATLTKLRDQDLLDEKMRAKMLRGVSTRDFEEVIDGYSEKLGVSKSAVSRAFIRGSQKVLDEINHGSLEKYKFVSIMIDGINVAGRMVIAILGITDKLEKVVIGLREGETENAEVVKDLLTSLDDRNFTFATDRLLAVIDGSKALKKAIRSMYGEKVVIQRCWLHKLRNIQAYIPQKYHKALHFKLKRVMGMVSFEEAQKELKLLREWLSEISFDAVSSLDEAGDDLLSLHSLAISGALRKSLSSTNLIESIFSGVRTKISRVKNWKCSQTNQRMRWVASAVQQLSPNMRKLRGLSQAPSLLNALTNIAIEKIAA